jgi:putative addiction module killer protein
LEISPKEIRSFKTQSGHVPFFDWLDNLTDAKGRHLIKIRLDRLASGLYGDCGFVGDSIFELRIHYGPEYRIYFAHDKESQVFLLCGGIKSSQNRDIAQAKIYWHEAKGKK